jgi:hypothetical protein
MEPPCVPWFPPGTILVLFLQTVLTLRTGAQADERKNLGMDPPPQPEVVSEVPAIGRKSLASPDFRGLTRRAH